MGIRVNSLHAPYSKDLDITAPSETDRRRAVEEIIAAAAALPRIGGQTLVLHGGSENEKAVDSPVQRLDQSIKSLGEIYVFCRKIGIRMAIEDMLAHLLGGRTREVEWIVGKLPPDVGICLDTGHSFLSGDLLGRLRAFAPRLITLHVHDNRGKKDDHLPPGEGNINWPELTNALEATGFRGQLILEITGSARLQEAITRARKSAAFLSDLIANARQ